MSGEFVIRPTVLVQWTYTEISGEEGCLQKDIIKLGWKNDVVNVLRT